MVKTVNDIREYKELKDGQTIKPYEKSRITRRLSSAFQTSSRKSTGIQSGTHTLIKRKDQKGV